jgi:hypothetical protein
MGRGPADKNGGSEAEEVAAYVATMAVELKGLVVPHNMRSLSYLLDLVRLEAEERARGGHRDLALAPREGG